MRLRPVLLAALTALALSPVAPLARAADWGDARKAFRDALKSPEWKERRVAYQAMLDQDRPEAVEEILSAIAKEDNGAVVAEGLKTLGFFQRAESLTALGAAAKAGRGAKRVHALLALQDNKGDGGKEALLEVVAGKDALEAGLAALALGKKKVAAAVPAITALLKHKDWQVRGAAARALTFLGPAVGKESSAALVEALAASENRDRTDEIDALEAIHKQTFGYDVEAWRAFLSGTPAASVPKNPTPSPYVFGMPILARRVSVVVDHSVCTDDPTPFADMTRMKEVCAVPGARDVPWFSIKTTAHLFAAHAKRLIADLPDGSGLEVVVAGGPKVKAVFGRLTPVNGGTRATVEKALDSLRPENGLDALSAVQAALDAGGKDSQAWGSGPEEVVVLACGTPWLAAVTDQEVVAGNLVLKARMRLVPIDTVGVGNHAFVLMRTLAEGTGGKYVNLTK